MQLAPTSSAPNATPPATTPARELFQRIDQTFRTNIVSPLFEIAITATKVTLTPAEVMQRLNMPVFNAEIGAALALGAHIAPSLAKEHAVAVRDLVTLNRQFEQLAADTTTKLTGDDLGAFVDNVRNVSANGVWFYGQHLKHLES